MGGGIAEKEIQKKRPDPEKEANQMMKKDLRSVDGNKEEEKRQGTMNYDFRKTIGLQQIVLLI